jgi:hypothetical protein
VGQARVLVGLLARCMHPDRSACPRGGRRLSSKENTMPTGDLEIHVIVLRMLREGYASLTAAQRRIVDALMAVC